MQRLKRRVPISPGIGPRLEHLGEDCIGVLAGLLGGYQGRALEWIGKLDENAVGLVGRFRERGTRGRHGQGHSHDHMPAPLVSLKECPALEYHGKSSRTHIGCRESVAGDRLPHHCRN